MTLLPMLCIWVCSQFVQIQCGILAWRQPSDANGRRRLDTLDVSMVASILPLVSLLAIMFALVIAQPTLWLAAWPLMFFGNPIALAATVLMVCLPPYPPKQAYSFVSRVSAVIAAVCACVTAFNFFPDA